MPFDPSALSPDAQHFVQLLGDLAQMQTFFSGEVDTLRGDIERLEGRLAQAQEAEALLQALFAAAEGGRGVALMSLDARGLIRSWSACAAELYGYGSDEMLGAPAASLEEACLEDSTAFRRRLHMRRKDGGFVAVEALSVPVRRGDTLLGYVRLDREDGRSDGRLAS